MCARARPNYPMSRWCKPSVGECGADRVSNLVRPVRSCEREHTAAESTAHHAGAERAGANGALLGKVQLFNADFKIISEGSVGFIE